jgi:polysaccharide pyruvyl transferase WcaK-like protein
MFTGLKLLSAHAITLTLTYEMNLSENSIRTVTLLNDTAGRANPGCQLTSRTLRALLEQSAEVQGQHLDIRPYPWHFAKRVDTRDQTLRRLLASGQAFSEEALRRLSVVEYGQAAVADTIASDVVVFQPEGTVSDGDSLLKLLRLFSLPLYAANFQNKPLVVINGTFPLISDEREPLVAWLRELSTAFVLRDRISADHWKGDFMPDTALSWQGQRAEPSDFVLITTGAEVPENTDRRLMHAALDVCRRKTLKPLVATKDWKRFLFAEDQVKQLGGEFHKDVDLEGMDNLLMKCRLHVGGRYHMAILAATKGVPSVLIRTNTHKNEWLAQEFDGVSCCVIENLASEALSLLSRGDEVGDALVNKTRDMAQSSVEHCARIFEQVDKNVAKSISPPSVPHQLKRMVHKDHVANIFKRLRK